MSNKKIDNIPSVISISGFENSRKLGRILNHEGVIPLLFALQEKPQLFKELNEKLKLPSTTFERALRDLHKEINIIRKNPIVADNRKTNQYILNPIGNDLARFIKKYERFMAVSIPEQKVLEIEKIK
jgi:DNA-binding HxlR family transcriptional regulator